MTARAPRSLLLAAPMSGSGKTVVTLGLLRALARRGVEVAGAKSGPDYIDPAFHAAACGRASVNLDAWAMDGAALRGLAQAQSSEVLLVEGAMGWIDGAVGGDRVGSAADLARALGAPTVLVVDAAKACQSVALAFAGARALRPDLAIAGVILNRVGSERHAAAARKALEAAGARVFGAIPRLAALETPSRHLGLVPAAERPDLERFIGAAADVADRHIDVDGIVEAARPVRASRSSSAAAPPPLGARIAVAQDQAFAFAYPHLLRAWRAAGAEIAPFAPLEDQAPDPAADAIFLPGGYPELHAGRLAAADRFRAGMQRAASQGARIYGECGGYMALGRGLIDAQGVRHAMLGLLPVETSFETRRLTLGYRRLRALEGAPFEGSLAGHEFHYATIGSEGAGPALFEAWDAAGRSVGALGRIAGRVAGSFAHVISPWPTRD